MRRSTRAFSNKSFVRLKSHQIRIFRIKTKHLRRITAIHWKNERHERKIHVSILLMVDASISFINM
ncbi:conserved hypothetical protein [Vibrio chagasii]|nr:conserved hypothetical protein [Vibrio chagasii]CAH6826454.1 conserved hypothetical protein [Vibrio chagasii]CAH6858101.1 conserved hypothetical protein [Vibrio chagasii]CAH6861403.1 conserved hypothetical protein [Vibrio chagasii]CAH6865105.1 conserved hypothetical protein [Vibrio chagasii]